jgi:hypothetical protein
MTECNTDGGLVDVRRCFDSEPWEAVRLGADNLAGVLAWIPATYHPAASPIGGIVIDFEHGYGEVEPGDWLVKTEGLMFFGPEDWFRKRFRLADGEV